MIRRFYVNNFRCLENYDLPIVDRPSVLLIRKDGAGKTTIRSALEIVRPVLFLTLSDGRSENMP